VDSQIYSLRPIPIWIANGEKATGVGEPAVTVVAPALGNAIFNTCGARVHSLPITAEAVKAGSPSGGEEHITKIVRSALEPH
jgi:CO/xanthine dehydrogenase Mo-binding subunit